LEGSPRLRQLEENSASPKDLKHETITETIEGRERAPSQVRGMFMKEHISPIERQKEHNQKRFFKEQLE